MDNTPNLDLPLIAASQAQKHVTHNEAIAALDTLVHLTVESMTETAPPGGALEGDRHIVGAAATGAWAGHDGDIAQLDAGGWRFIAPAVGMRAWVLDATLLAVRLGAWVPFAPTMIGVNTMPDATNRLAVASDASLFTHDGSDHRMKVNKATAGDTASFLFQTGYSGRAEFGLAGSDDFSVKVSPDGAVWHDGLSIDRATGALTFRLPSFTVATLPAASPAARLIYVADGAGNKRMAVSDGTDWRWPDGAVVS